MREPSTSVHLGHPWLVSFAVACAVCLPAASIVVALEDRAAVRVALAALVAIWFLGGGIRRARQRDRAATPPEP